MSWRLPSSPTTYSLANRMKLFCNGYPFSFQLDKLFLGLTRHFWTENAKNKCGGDDLRYGQGFKRVAIRSCNGGEEQKQIQGSVHSAALRLR